MGKDTTDKTDKPEKTGAGGRAGKRDLRKVTETPPPLPGYYQGPAAGDEPTGKAPESDDCR